MSATADLQGAATLQSEQSNVMNGGMPNTLQSGDGTSLLQATPSTLAVVGDKPSAAGGPPITDTAIIVVVIFAALLGASLWLKD